MNLSNIIYAVAALSGTGGVSAYFYYLGNRRKNNAEGEKTQAQARKIDSDIKMEEWAGWRGYAEKLEDRMTLLEKKIDIVTTENIALRQENTVLKEKVRELTQKVASLEQVNVGYEEAKTVAKEELHSAVDANINNIP